MMYNYFESYEYIKSEYYLKKCREPNAVLPLTQQDISQATQLEAGSTICHGFGKAGKEEGLLEAVRCALREMSVNALIKPQTLVITIFAEIEQKEAEQAAEYIRNLICESDAKVLLGFSRETQLLPFEVMIIAYTSYPKEKEWDGWGSRELYEADRKLVWKD